LIRQTTMAVFLAAGILAGCDSNLLDRDEDVMDNLRSDVAVLRARIEQLETENATLQAASTDHGTRVGTLETASADHETKLASVTMSGTDFVFTGVNVHVRSGSGATDGSMNGLGNLIVGYDEARTVSSDKSGSHNLVIGPEHSYPSYGGLVAGLENTISGPYASVSGGFYNTASVICASVSGGNGCDAEGIYSSVSGGVGNHATGDWSSVSGGNNNTAGTTAAHVCGGSGNDTTTEFENLP
jgi:outer membrane murein-binding lipoprotein Lpp